MFEIFIILFTNIPNNFNPLILLSILLFQLNTHLQSKH